jgi:hypothetical protein
VPERHLPTAEVPLFINFGAPHRSVDRGAAQWTTHDGTWVVGVQRHHRAVAAVGTREFMIVRFTPIGAHRFLDVPMTLLAGAVIELALIRPALARMVDSRVRAAQRWGAC